MASSHFSQTALRSPLTTFLLQNIEVPFLFFCHLCYHWTYRQNFLPENCVLSNWILRNLALGGTFSPTLSFYIKVKLRAKKGPVICPARRKSVKAGLWIQSFWPTNPVWELLLVSPYLKLSSIPNFYPFLCKGLPAGLPAPYHHSSFPIAAVTMFLKF